MLLCLLLSCCGKFIEFGRLVDIYVHVMCTHTLIILSSTKVTVCLYTVILSAFFTLYMFAVLCIIIIIIIIAFGSSTLVCAFCHNKLTVLRTQIRVKGTSSPMCSTVQYFVNLSQLKGKDTRINKTLLGLIFISTYLRTTCMISVWVIEHYVQSNCLC